MKKFRITLVLTFILLAGCAVNEGQDSEVSPTASVTAPPPAVEESAAIKEVTVTETPATDLKAVTTPIINAKDIARKTTAEVDGILGEPVFTEDINFGMGPELKKQPVTMNYYVEMLEDEMGRVEIMFIKGKAERIRINLIGEQYDKKDKSTNFDYIGLSGVKLEPVNQVKQIAYDVDGFYSVEVGDWLGTDDGTILLVTEESFK